MKKTLSVVAAFASLALAATVISCGNPGDVFSGALDTVLNLDAPAVSAKAYPGVNYITWEPIAGAKQFKLIRTADGETGTADLGTFTSQYEYADIASGDHILVNGKTYKYTVQAISSSDPSRSVYVKSSQASASVTAIVPQAGLAVDEFTDGYSTAYFTKLKSAANRTQTVANGTIDSSIFYSTTGDGALYATYPATAGFKYGVKFLGAGEASSGATTLYASATKVNYKEDYVANYVNTAVTAGKKDVYLTVASVSSLYQPITIKVGEYEVKDIDESAATKDQAAQWLSTSKVRVYWTAATLKATGLATPTKNYVVYRADQSDNYTAWTKLTGSVVKGEKTTTTATPTVTEDIYYIDDTVANPDIAYKYYIVHTDGTYFASAYLTAPLAKYAYVKTGAPTVTAEVYNNDINGYADTIKITATTNATDYNQTLTISYVKLAEDAKDAVVTTYPASSFTNIPLANNNGMTSSTTGNSQSWTVFLNDKDPGSYLIKVVASETGKESNVAYRFVTIADPAVGISDLVANFGKFTISGNEIKAVTIVDKAINDYTDVVDNYIYDLYKVVITHTDNFYSTVEVSTTKVNTDNPIKLTKVTLNDDLNKNYGLTEGYYSAARSVGYEYNPGKYDNAFFVRKTLKNDTSVYAQKKVSGTYN